MKTVKLMLSKPTMKQLFGMIVLLLAYFVTGTIGLSIFPINHFVTLIWAPSGIAIAALVIYGLELWPAVFVGAFLVNSTSGAPVPVALGIALGNTLEALAAGYLLREVFHFSPMFSRLRDSFSFIVVCFSTSLVASTIGDLSLWIGGSLSTSDFYQSWLLWWVGDSLGMLILGPFLIRWMYRIFFTKNLYELFEGALLFGTLVLITVMIFWGDVEQIGNIPMVYILFVPLIWAALRAGPRGMTLALFLTSAVAISGAIVGHGVTSGLPGIQGLLQMQILLGTLSMIFLIFVSIVEERKEAIVSLRDHIGQLEEAFLKIKTQDEAKTEFIATLAHELRNPLSPIVSAIELMETNTVAPQEVPKVLHTIHTHVRTISRLLDDLLDISRITRKKFKLQKTKVELQSIIHHSREIVAAFYKERNHRLILDVPSEPIWLVADMVRLEQIFVNLLFNAGKYTEPGGTITLTCTVDDVVRISIKDTGIGIAPEMLREIFEPFVQAKISEERVGSGLGIGLSLTKHLVALHDGNIWAQSEGQGHGSEFIIEFPLPNTLQLLIAEPVVPSPSVVGTKKHKILVVDDNEAAAKGLGSLLTHSGHNVELAYDGAKALEKVKQFDPRVVLLDIGLPGMDGYEVARKMKKEKNGGVVLIAVTGYGQDDDKQKAKDAGFSHHLTKPVGISEVEEVLGRIGQPSLV